MAKSPLTDDDGRNYSLSDVAEEPCKIDRRTFDI